MGSLFIHRRLDEKLDPDFGHPGHLYQIFTEIIIMILNPGLSPEGQKILTEVVKK
jgi:hypothetical protein